MDGYLATHARGALRLATLSCVFLLAACGASGDNPGEGGGDNGCANRCTAFGWEECLSEGEFADPIACGAGEVCLPESGCGVCIPGARYCEGQEQFLCRADGSGGDKVGECEGDLVCSNGHCKTACEKAEDEPSNVGCNFWAVDLDNEATGGFINNDAAAQQYAVAIANNNYYPVTANIYRNAGQVGQPLQEELVKSVMVPPQDLVQIDLPQREVDGTMGQNGGYTMGSGSGTFVSPHGYRIETTGPVVAYQFNPIIQQFSNDASILIPNQALGEHYYVLGYPTANPCGEPPGSPLHQESVPDYTAVTIVGTEDNTTINVTPTHPIRASSGPSGLQIPATAAGETLTLTINKYDVVNLESDQPQVSIVQCISMLDRDGDFTGTQVTSNAPVAVFSSLERGIGTGGVDIPTAPGWDGETCCTDHLEQQMFPTAALGWNFAVSRSPIRSTSTWVEPDIYRVVATVDNTTIHTNLPGEYASFTLNAGEYKAFYAQTGFTLSSEGGAVMLGQYLLSQGYIPDGGIGDPSFVVFPAAEQHRKEYVFLIPTTFEKNYMVLSKPQDASIAIDGATLPEFNNCQTAPVGEVNGIMYDQITCEMPEGVHTVSSNLPVGLTVYGYYNVGSYAYPGGSDVKIINPIE